MERCPVLIFEAQVGEAGDVGLVDRAAGRQEAGVLLWWSMLPTTTKS